MPYHLPCLFPRAEKCLPELGGRPPFAASLAATPGNVAPTNYEVLAPQVLLDELPGSHHVDPFVAGGAEQRTVTADDAVRPARHRAFKELDVVPIRAGIVGKVHGDDQKGMHCDAIEHRS